MRNRSRYGWLELITGILLILLGLFTMLHPDRILTCILFLYGLVAVIMGIADILLFIRMERFMGFGPALSLISGILSVMAGIMLLSYPQAGVLALSLLFPIWFIAHCISRLAHLQPIRWISGDGVYYFTLIVNAAGLVLGILMLLRPILTLSAIGMIAGLYLILLGIDSVVMAVSKIGIK